MSSTRVGGQAHAQVAEFRARVPAAHVLGRIAEHVVRVHQGDHKAEGLREVGALQPALGLLGVDLVPALAERARVARAEVLGLGVLAGVRRLPVGESVVPSQALRVRWRPAAEQ